jgi:hypothetical protein
VRVNLNYLRHYNQKKALVKVLYTMPDVCHLPAQHAPPSNEEKSYYYPIGGRYNQRPPVSDNKQQFTPTKGMVVQIETNHSSNKRLFSEALKTKSDSSSTGGKKRDSKKLRKLIENVKFEGFLSCNSQDDLAFYDEQQRS